MTWCHDKVLWRQLSSTLPSSPFTSLNLIWLFYVMHCHAFSMCALQSDSLPGEARDECSFWALRVEGPEVCSRCIRWQASDSHSMPQWKLLTFEDADSLEDAVERSVKRVEVLQRQATSKAYDAMPPLFIIFPVPVLVKATCAYIYADSSTVKVDTLSSRLHQHESSLDDLRRKFEAACSNCYACLPWKLWALSIEAFESFVQLLGGESCAIYWPVEVGFVAKMICFENQIKSDSSWFFLFMLITNSWWEDKDTTQAHAFSIILHFFCRWHGHTARQRILRTFHGATLFFLQACFHQFLQGSRDAASGWPLINH